MNVSSWWREMAKDFFVLMVWYREREGVWHFTNIIINLKYYSYRNCCCCWKCCTLVIKLINLLKCNYKQTKHSFICVLIVGRFFFGNWGKGVINKICLINWLFNSVNILMEFRIIFLIKFQLFFCSLFSRVNCFPLTINDC